MLAVRMEAISNLFTEELLSYHPDAAVHAADLVEVAQAHDPVNICSGKCGTQESLDGVYLHAGQGSLTGCDPMKCCSVRNINTIAGGFASNLVCGKTIPKIVFFNLNPKCLTTEKAFQYCPRNLPEDGQVLASIINIMHGALVKLKVCINCFRFDGPSSNGDNTFVPFLDKDIDFGSTNSHFVI